MKRICILLLLLCATLAVARRYWFPMDFPEVTPSYIVTKRAPQKVIKNTVLIRPTAAPELPLAEVEDAIYKEFVDVAGSTVYSIVDGSSLDWVRTDNNEIYPGEVRIHEGKIAVKGGNIVAGAFIIDMSSIRLKGGDPDILEEIISTTDLDVAQFPEASFILQESLGGTIRGILTIKGVSKQVTFPALVLVSNNKLRIHTEFSIDRKHRGIIGSSPTLSPYVDLRLERILKKI